MMLQPQNVMLEHPPERERMEPMQIHAGPIMPKVSSIERHCETTQPNDGCPYIRFGCEGCSLPGHVLEQRRERAEHENRVLGLPENADGIDRMAAAAGRTRDEQIAEMDPAARAVKRLVAVGATSEKAAAAVRALIDIVGVDEMTRQVRMICDMVGRQAPSILGPGIPASSSHEHQPLTWKFISPAPPRSTLSDLTAALDALPVKGRSCPPSGKGKRAQRRMLTPWAQRGAGR